LLEKVTLRPEELVAEDAEAVLDAGVTEQQVVDALRVCWLFNVINRVADGLGFDMPTERQFERGAKHLLARGYARRGA
jgi:alkylhydroperoxidase family enzyme